MAVPRTDDELRSLARLAHALAIAGLIAIAVLIGVNHVLAAVRAYWRTRGDVDAAAPALVTMLPLFFFADATNRFRRVFARFAEGAYFESGPARLVRDAGIDVAWAIAAAALIVPTLLHWIGDDHGALVLRIESETVALFAFATFVVVMGMILERAAALKAEHDAII